MWGDFSVSSELKRYCRDKIEPLLRLLSVIGTVLLCFKTVCSPSSLGKVVRCNCGLSWITSSISRSSVGSFTKSSTVATHLGTNSNIFWKSQSLSLRSLNCVAIKAGFHSKSVDVTRYKSYTCWLKVLADDILISIYAICLTCRIKFDEAHIQWNLLISNNRLSRSENLVPVLTQRSTNRQQNIVEKRRNCSYKEQFLLFSTIFSIYR